MLTLGRKELKTGVNSLDPILPGKLVWHLALTP